LYHKTKQGSDSAVVTLKKTEPGKFSYLYPKTKQGSDRAVATLINKKSIGIIKLICSHKNKAKRN